MPPEQQHSQTAAAPSRWRRAFRDQAGLLWVGAVYIVAVLAQAVYCHVRPADLARVGYAVALLFVKAVGLLLALRAGVFIREFFSGEAKRERGFAARAGRAHRRASAVADAYIDSEAFAYGMVGLLVAVSLDFFFVQKSLAHLVHPYAWDDFFIATDRFLHFGRLPDEFVIPLVNALHLGHVLDIAYFLWFLVMYAGLGFNLFCDRDLKRRLRFLWCFLLSWTVLGSFLAVVFSAAGPLYYHDFFPDRPDVYANLVEYIKMRGPHDFPIGYWSGTHLLSWTNEKDHVINPNAVIAFPSLHIAVAWAVTLYMWAMDRRLGFAAGVFTFLIYLATIMVGFHYAVDDYFSLAAVSAMWWIAGWLLDRRYPDKVVLAVTPDGKTPVLSQ